MIARTSSFAFQGRHIDAREIGRKLNARYLLEGSLQSDHGRLRVIAQLVDSTTGVHVWSMRFDRTPQDLFALQDEIAVAVARALEFERHGECRPRIAQQDTKNLEAWIAYQQGRALAATRKKADLERATERFAEAMRRDPAFASAYVALAETRLLLTLFSTSDTWLGSVPLLPSSEARAQIERLLARAIALNGRDGRAYLVRAWIQEDAAQAEADYRRGLALSPNDAMGDDDSRNSVLFGPQGEFFDPVKRPEAFEMIDRARELDPLTPTAHLTKAIMVLYGRSDIEQANALLLQALTVQPNYYPALMRLAELRWCCQGETAEGIKYGEQALALEPQASWPRHYLVRFYLDLEDPQAAEEIAAASAPADRSQALAIHLYRREWQTAGEIAYGPLDTMISLDRPLLAQAYVPGTQGNRVKRSVPAHGLQE